MLTKDTVEHATERRRVEWMLVVITLGLVALLNTTIDSKSVVLNLFYLPVVCAGFFLGRYRAGALAFLSVIAVSVVVMSDQTGFATSSEPVMVLLTLSIWGSALGLTAVFVGTLSDDRQAKSHEAREAYMGVVEVLSSYLQAVNPRLQHRARRVAELSEKVGRKLRLSDQEIDNIRLASLMLDMEPLEITSRVIRKAVDEVEDPGMRTLPGSELVQSLGRVLTGAFPIAQSVVQADDFSGRQRDQSRPLSAEVIRTVRAYLHLIQRPLPAQDGGQTDPFEELEMDDVLSVPSAVIDALRTVINDERTEQVLSVISASGSHRFAAAN